MKNKKKILGIPLTFVLIGIVGLIGVSAALLTLYGTLTTAVNVDQSVKVDNQLSGVIIDDNGGLHKLKNKAGSIAPVNFTTECSTNATDCIGITTSYVGVLDLTTKVVDFGVTPWAENDKGKATIHYNLTGDTFDWELVDSTIDLSGYTLIYYKDNSDRFNDPASAILVNEITGDLPYESDGNVDEYNYCNGGTEGEIYVHCHGAKLWLVPNECRMSNGTHYVIDWDEACADRFLFETDLMAFSKNNVGKLNLPANGGGVNFKIVNDLNVALKPDTYTITTTVIPK